MKKKTTTSAYERQVKPPYSVQNIGGVFFLKKGKEIVRSLRAQSENGADREASIFLGIKKTV